MLRYYEGYNNEHLVTVNATVCMGMFPTEAIAYERLPRDMVFVIRLQANHWECAVHILSSQQLASMNGDTQDSSELAFS